MLVAVIGTKGGVGTTSLALHLAQAMNGVGLDAADGRLAALLERKTWTLAGVAFSVGRQRQGAVDRIVRHRITLLWTPECNLGVDGAWSVVQAVADRAPVVADGGIDPLPQIVELANAILVVGARDDPVSQYHEERLVQQFPGASVVALDLARSRTETKDAARELAASLKI
jgi:hypothetical protein